MALAKPVLICVSVAVLLGACSTKPAPQVLPPTPPTPPAQPAAPPPAPSGTTDGTMSATPTMTAPASSATPGSQADLAESSGSDRVFFGYDADTLDAASQETLKLQADWLGRNAGVKLQIEGHCDERGTREYNLALGDRRAEAVRSYLVSLGVSPDRLTTISYGKERPEIVGSDDASYAKNRRSVSMVRGS